MGRPSLSILSLVHESPGRVATLLDPFADLNREVILAVDDRVPSSWIGDYRQLADRVLVVPFPGAFAYLYAWLVSECAGRWIFHIDDDEIPSVSLAGEIEAAMTSDDITHAWVARRWLWPDQRSFLSQAPWRSDFHPRLMRNDPAVLRVPGQPHHLLAPVGQRRFLRAPFWHAHLLLRPYEARLQRGEELERDRPGVTVAGRSVNEAYYLPERDAAPLVTTDLPEDDVIRVAGYLDADEGVGRRRLRRGSIRKFSADQIAAVTKSGPLPDAAYRARLKPVHEGSMKMPADNVCEIEVEVTNLGNETWPGGEDANPAIRLGARWLGEEGKPQDPGMRTYLGAPLAPGQTALVLAVTTTPPTPGTDRLDIDLVHEHVRWFGASIVVDIEVDPASQAARRAVEQVPRS